MSKTTTLKRDTVIFYRSFYEALKALPAESQSKLYTAIFEYSLNFQLIELDGVEQTIFTLIKPQLDANNKRFMNGNEGGVKGKSEPKRNQNGTKTRARANQARGKSEPNNNNNNNNNNNHYHGFLNFFNSLKGSGFKGSDKVRKSFNARITEGYTMDDIQKAIKNCYNTPYHQENPKFLTPEFILRPDKLEMYLNVTEVKTITPEVPKGLAMEIGERDKLFTV